MTAARSIDGRTWWANFKVIRPATHVTPDGPFKAAVHMPVRSASGTLLKTVGATLNPDDAEALGRRLIGEAAIARREAAQANKLWRESQASDIAENGDE
jgi:hypothetical protein